MTLSSGDKAPSFTMKNTDLQDVSLADYQGKNLVLLFFPLAFTSVCTDELCYMRDNLSVYENLNSSILGISVDSPFTLKKFKEENNLNFPIASDFNKEVSKSYGAFYEDFVLGLKGVSKRAAFIINAEGNIHYSEVLDSAGDLPNFENLKNALSEIN